MRGSDLNNRGVLIRAYKFEVVMISSNFMFLLPLSFLSYCFMFYIIINQSEREIDERKKERESERERES